MDSLSNYTPKDEREAQSICERITPRLAHANAAVVLSAVKVLMKYMEMMPQVRFYLNSLNYLYNTNPKTVHRNILNLDNLVSRA